MQVTFAQLLNSLDPQLTEEGKPYGPHRYKEIVKERFVISKHTNTSYKDTEEITPVERGYILEFILEDLQHQKEMYDKAQRELEAQKHK